MYSSMDKPTFKDWAKESERLLDELQHNINIYTKKIKACDEKENAVLLKYYCVKLHDANKRLEIPTVELQDKLE